MVAVGTAIPGCSFANEVYTIPVSAINNLLGSSPIGTTDAFERLLYGLVQCLYLKNQAATLTETSCGVEVAAKSLGTGTWEVSSQVFTNVTVGNFLISFNLGSTAITEDPSELQCA